MVRSTLLVYWDMKPQVSVSSNLPKTPCCHLFSAFALRNLMPISRIVACIGLTLSISNSAISQDELKFDEIVLETNLNARLIVNEDEIATNIEQILATSEKIAKVDSNESDSALNNEPATNIISSSADSSEDNISEDDTNQEQQANLEAEGTSETIEQPDDLQQISQEIDAAMQGWASAWSDQNVDAYLNHYAAEFTPAKDSMSRAQWVAQRKQRLENPSRIELSLSDIELTGIEDQITRVVFRQNYRSDNYSDEIIKSLDFVNVEGDWKILSEKTVKVLK